VETDEASASSSATIHGTLAVFEEDEDEEGVDEDEEGVDEAEDEEEKVDALGCEVDEGDECEAANDRVFSTSRKVGRLVSITWKHVGHLIKAMLDWN